MKLSILLSLVSFSVVAQQPQTTISQISGVTADTTNSIVVINAKTAYGAKGDGTTDDSASLQNAINAAESSGSPLYLPTGTYKTTVPLYITNWFTGQSANGNIGGFLLQGDGPTKTVIHQTSANIDGLWVTNYNSSNPYFFQMYGVSVVGNNPNNTGSGIIGGNSSLANNWVIKNCMFQAWSNGVWAALEDSIVENTIFNNNQTGYWLNGSGPGVNNTIDNCPFIIQDSMYPNVTGHRCIGLRVTSAAYDIRHLDIGNSPMNPCILIENFASIGSIDGCNFEVTPNATNNNNGTSCIDYELAGLSKVKNCRFVATGLSSTNDYPILWNTVTQLILENNLMSSWPAGGGVNTSVNRIVNYGSYNQSTVLDNYFYQGYIPQTADYTVGGYQFTYALQPSFYSTNYSTSVNAAGYTNFTGLNRVINIFGTAGSNVFYMRGGQNGITPAAVPIFTNINTANGLNIRLPAFCGVQIVNGAGMRIQVYDSP